MKKTWYVGAFLILFSFLGVHQFQVSEPNQEIVLNFSDVDITTDEAQSAITVVKKQLQSIGIITVRVQDLKDGQLKITYYSDSEVESIKKILLGENKIQIAHLVNNTTESSSGFPSNKEQKNYKLDVFEINKDNDSGSGLGGKYVLNLKQDYDRLHNTNFYGYNNAVDTKGENNIVKVALKVFKNIATEIDNASRNIPEVRAGPTIHGIA